MLNRLMREKKLLEAQLRDANNLADQWAQRNIALEAECERLREALTISTAKQLSETCAELRAELAAAKGQDEHNKEQADGHDN